MLLSSAGSQSPAWEPMSTEHMLRCHISMFTCYYGGSRSFLDQVPNQEPENQKRRPFMTENNAYQQVENRQYEISQAKEFIDMMEDGFVDTDL